MYPTSPNRDRTGRRRPPPVSSPCILPPTTPLEAAPRGPAAPGSREVLPVLDRRRLLLASASALAGLPTYAWYIEPHWLQWVRLDLPVRGLPPALEGTLLVHLTDLHIGRDVAEAYLAEVFRKAAALRPAIVAVTGDFTSFHDGVLAQAERVLAGLPRGRLATVGVLGNHDYGQGPTWSDYAHADKLAALLERSGLTVLRNQRLDVAGLQLVGLDDLWSGRFDLGAALAGLDPAAPALALSHNPDSADQAGWEPFRGWILAGHTHGGQIKPPFLHPPVLPVANRRYVAGPYRLSGERWMYIGRGVGHLHLQARFNARPEVTVFRLRRG